MPQSLRIVYAGTPEFAVPALEALLASPHEVVAVYTQPDRPAGRGRKLRPSPVKTLALEHGLPVEQPETLKTAEARSTLKDYRPDVMVVAAYGLILPQAVLDIPRYGCLNIHASLLPRWRGAAPIQRAILAGDAETGVTIMQMAAGLDTGDMLARRRLPIGERDDAARIHDRLAQMGADVLLPVLDALPEGVVGESQDPAEATYASKLDKAEAELDWTRPADELARAVRAFNPWPVAFTRLGGEPLRIWRATSVSAQKAESGAVLNESDRGIDVACGDGALRIEELQLPGGRRMPVAEFLKARSLAGLRLPT